MPAPLGNFTDFTTVLYRLQWHSLSREEQAKYYEEARKERQLHMQKYPGWSARDNYAMSKKKKRKRDEVPGSKFEFSRLKVASDMALGKN